MRLEKEEEKEIINCVSSGHNLFGCLDVKDDLAVHKSTSSLASHLSVCPLTRPC